MTDSLLREIVEAAINNQIFASWRFYALFVSLNFLVGVLGYWTASYLKKRAEVSAIKADMAEILRQLEITTRTTEQTKVAVSQLDWAQREWRATRKVKLEELLKAAYALDKWLKAQQDQWLHLNDQNNVDRPLEKRRLIGKLYFPDLQQEVDEVWNTYMKAGMYIVSVGGAAGKARLAKNADEYGAALDTFKNGWTEHYQPAQAKLFALEAAASKLMHSIAGA